jgi:hypothetical protein
MTRKGDREGGWDKGKKRCEVWELKGNGTLMCEKGMVQLLLG